MGINSTSPFYLFLLCIICWVSCSGPAQKEISEPDNEYYQEMHRPLIHFTPETQWMNDPNGMFFLDGEYHLFYQYYPDSNVWGPMHWGHAVSQDLVTWKHLPIALYPDSLGYIFSGSAVVDWNNTSGFGSEGNPPIIAIFTHHDPKGEEAGTNDFQYQSIAYSLDKGYTWEKYEGNPVLGSPGIRDFRDPKVFWHTDTEQWIMSLAVKDHIRFYASPDFKEWEFLSSFGEGIGAQGGLWECPDLFPMNVGETEEEKWVLLVSVNPQGPNGGSATQYFVGDFDGESFNLESGFLDQGPVWLDYGRDNYAGVTWSDIPESDGRRLFIGWMSNWDYARDVPTYVWRSAMTVPRELKLGKDLRLSSIPLAEFESIRKEITEIPTPDGVNGRLDISSEMENIPESYELKFNIQTQEKFKLIFSNDLGEFVELEVDPLVGNCNFYRDESGDLNFSEKFAGLQIAPLISSQEKIDVHVIMDRSSIEVFLGEYKTVFTALCFPSELYKEIQLITHGPAEVDGMEIVSLQSIW